MTALKIGAALIAVLAAILLGTACTLRSPDKASMTQAMHPPSRNRHSPTRNRSRPFRDQRTFPKVMVTASRKRPISHRDESERA